MQLIHSIRSTVAVLLVTASSQAMAITGEYFGPFAYQNVADSQTIITWADFNLQSVPYDPDYHLAFGARGGSSTLSAALGRGITIGHVGQDHDGYPGLEVGCSGIMIEDFTKNIFGADGDPFQVPSRGLIPGTCYPISFLPNSSYRVYLHVSKLNVYWQLYENVYNWATQSYDLQLVSSGGCYESTGVFCPEHSQDGSYGEVFVAGTGVDAVWNWNYGNLGITHY